MTEEENKTLAEEFGIKPELISQPYYQIVNYAESIYKYIGGIVFRYASLMPVSLIAPPLTERGKKIKIGINILLLAVSGSGKSSLANVLKNITIEPIDALKFTTAGLEKALKCKDRGTIIIQDLARTSQDIESVKMIENAIGEEQGGNIIMAKGSRRIDGKFIAMMCGVPHDVSEKLTSGILSRCVSLLVFHSQEQMDEIGDNIIKGLGKKAIDTNINEEDIKNYYLLLQKIQNGEIEKYKPIENYYIPEEYGKIFLESWKTIRSTIPKILGEDVSIHYFNRELFDGLRFLCLLAYLNYFNREKKEIDGEYCITPNSYDLENALHLMNEEIKIKFDIFRSEKFALLNGSNQRLKEIVFNSNKISPRMRHLVKIFLEKYKKR